MFERLLHRAYSMPLLLVIAGIAILLSTYVILDGIIRRKFGYQVGIYTNLVPPVLKAIGIVYAALFSTYKILLRQTYIYIL